MRIKGPDLRLDFNRASGGPFDGHGTLASGLVSYWKLDETSGTRVDAVTLTGNNLTDNATVTYANAGPSGNSAFFTLLNNEYLLKSSSSAFPFATSDLTVAVWVYCPEAGFNTGSAVVNYGLFGVGHNWELSAASASGLGFHVWDATPARIASATITGFEAGRWHLVVCTVDNAAKTAQIYRDGIAGTPGTWTIQTPAGTARPFAISSYSGTASFWTGAVANCGIWSRKLAAADITSIYNLGVGKRYADLTAADKVSLVSYWNLDEPSGSRADSFGSNTLTDGNTVTSRPSGPRGLVGNYVSASNEYLTRTTPASILRNSARTVALWFYMNPTSEATLGIASCGTLVADGNPIWLIQKNNNNIRLYLSTAYVADVPVSNGWHLAMYRHNGTTGVWSLNIDTITVASGTNADPVNGTDGSIWFGAGYQTRWNDKIGPAGLWSIATVSAATELSLFNAGVGKLYASLTAADITSLVAYYNMNEASGNRSDSSGNGYTLTDTNTVLSVDNGPAPPKGVAAQFTRTNSEYLSIADSSSTVWGEDGNGASISLWCNLSSVTTYGQLCGRADLQGMTIHTESGNVAIIYCTVRNNGVNIQQQRPAIAGVWQHVVAVWDGSTKKVTIYLNNQSAQSGAGANAAIDASSSAVVIGGGSGFVTGLIDSVGVWRRALTSQEVTDLWNSGYGLYY